MKALVSRRQGLARLAGLGAAMLAAACGGRRPVRTPGAAADPAPRTPPAPGISPAATPAGSPIACVLTPEVTQGPYYIDYARIRRDIRAGREGTRLDLRLTVLDATSCRPLAGAAVDVWHADAGGIYSGFEAASAGQGPPIAAGGGTSIPTDSHRFLRGTQLTDPRGDVAFVTIYPGWYTGRAVHIHMKVHRGGSVVHVGQLFFTDTLTDSVYRAEPYAARGSRDTRNASDSIFTQAGGPAAILAVTKLGSGYTGAITVGVR
jgi:protocatechuate 3,4-dioxygenase beta subunit